MKRHRNRMAGRLRAGLAALLCAALALPLFAGCTAAPKLGAPPAAAAGPETPGTATPGLEAPGTAAVEPEGGALLAGTVIDVSDGSLLLAGEGDYDGLYRLSLDGVPVEPGGVEALCVGKRAEVTFGGTVAECFPGIPGGVTRVRAVDGDLSPFVLYRQVLFDLMETDEGLNGGARYLGVDLSGAANLTGGEKLALQYLLEQRYGLSVVPGTFDELCEQGYIDRDALYWEDGVLLRVALVEDGTDTFRFDAEKWRSGLGAIYWTDCTAARGADGWTYEVGGFAIA